MQYRPGEIPKSPPFLLKSFGRKEKTIMDILKKIWKLIGSMQFAMGLLLVLILSCGIGSVISQGQTYEFYASAYGERAAGAIMALQLDDLFHSFWFILLSAFLCLNLLLCNLIRLPSILALMKQEKDPERSLQTGGTVSLEKVKDPEGFFKAMGFGSIRAGENARGTWKFSVRNLAGLWGAWVCHLGILLLILGFGLGQATMEVYTIYGLPGDAAPIGETGTILSIDSFDVELREDDTVEQYRAGITVRRPSDGKEESASISVNHPASLFGMKFFQNSTGWAADLHITKSGEPLQDQVIYAGDYAAVADKPELVIYLNAFYPDYVNAPGQGPMTASSAMNNPAYLYSVYFRGQILGMNALLQSEELTIDEYTVTFDNPRNYTLIQIKRDRFTVLALLGGLTVMLGLILAFYLQEERIWALLQEDGTWIVRGCSRKGGVLFGDRFLEEGKKFL